jgi:pilus assembly protein TadC
LVGDRELGIVEDMLSEIEVYANYKKRLGFEIKKLEAEYQAENYGYVAFKEKLDRILKGRSEEDWQKYYDAYIYSLAKRIDKILAELFYQVYSDKRVPIAEQESVAAQEPEQIMLHTPPLARPEYSPGKLGIDYPRYEDVKKEIIDAERGHNSALAEVRRKAQKPLPLKKPLPAVAVPGPKPLPVKKHFSLAKLLASWASSLKSALDKIPQPRLPKISFPHRKPKPAAEKKQPVVEKKPSAPIFSKFPSVSALFRKQPTPAKPASDEIVFKKGKSPFIDEVFEMEKAQAPVEKAPLKTSEGIAFGWFSARHLWEDIVGKFGKRQEPLMSEETEMPVQMKKLREVRKRLYDDEKASRFGTTLLAQEARRVRRILEVEKPSQYKSSSLGLIANVTVKKISLWLVDKLPDFFGILYNALRAANIKVLSNTYVNIMILISMVIFVVLNVILSFTFFALNYELYQIVLRTELISLMASSACVVIFFAYPFIKIKDRKKSITTNLPFAIDHIASVAASGVPPTKMFELIAASSEYGEVAVEIRKIVDFITIFGYDFLTAVKAVASTTPSLAFKEFLEGLISTIETGGDLDSFLRQKSEESTLTYQLERQRYNESVSTYSDIYTGLLIAAPLFFIASLTMVNLLGGTIGGIAVDTLMAICAYLVIPLLNIAFIVFLQLSQPDV